MSLITHVFKLGLAIGFVLTGFYFRRFFNVKIKQKRIKIKTQLIASIVEKIEDLIMIDITRDEAIISEIMSQAIEQLNELSIEDLIDHNKKLAFGWIDNTFWMIQGDHSIF